MQGNHKKIIVESLLKKGILVAEDIFDHPTDFNQLEGKVHEQGLGQLLFLNKDILSLIDQQIFDINWQELEQVKFQAEKAGNDSIYKKFLECAVTKTPSECRAVQTPDDIDILFDYREPVSKKEVKDFVLYYNARLRALEGLLRNRQELTGLTSIGRIINKRDRETVSIIGMVADKSITANNNIMLTIEDPSGKIKVLVGKNKQELHSLGKNITLDEVIGITGVCGDKIIFSTNIILPDVPLNKELKKCPEEIYAMFLSDLHVGSNNFLEDRFNKFLRWLNGEIGTDAHRQIIKKTRYLFIAGDLVDGVGIYPNQESELTIKDIYKQYEECAKLLRKIPPHIKILVCAGNHDSIRLSEPQPKFDREFAAPIYEIPNLIVMSNPCMVNIAAREGFPGFDVLMYHGYSFDYFISNIDYIRNNGGYDRADLVMKYLLQRRHLAPTHTATLYVPDNKKDPLFISRVPDFFISGHIHKSSVESYRNVSMICGSCWQSTTSFQVKVGHHPEPAQVPLVNLQTRQTKILRF